MTIFVVYMTGFVPVFEELVEVPEEETKRLICSTIVLLMFLFVIFVVI